MLAALQERVELLQSEPMVLDQLVELDHHIYGLGLFVVALLPFMAAGVEILFITEVAPAHLVVQFLYLKVDKVEMVVP